MAILFLSFSSNSRMPSSLALSTMPWVESASGCTALSTATMACFRVPSLYCPSTSCSTERASTVGYMSECIWRRRGMFWSC